MLIEKRNEYNIFDASHQQVLYAIEGKAILSFSAFRITLPVRFWADFGRKKKGLILYFPLESNCFYRSIFLLPACLLGFRMPRYCDFHHCIRISLFLYSTGVCSPQLKLHECEVKEKQRYAGPAEMGYIGQKRCLHAAGEFESHRIIWV